MPTGGNRGIMLIWYFKRRKI